MINYLKRLFLGEKPVHFTWTPKNRIEVEKLLKEYDIKYEITEDNYPQLTFISLYIDEVGGFVPENTKLLIYKNCVYKQITRKVKKCQKK